MSINGTEGVSTSSYNKTPFADYSGNLSNTNLDNVPLLISNNNSDENVTGSNFYGFSPDTKSNILNGITVFAALTVLVNCAVLVAFKFTTGGKSSTLVFMRSLCLGDVLIGMFGIFKCILLNNLDSRLINCFLPESVFVSASTTICLTLLWLNIDSYLRLMKPFGYVNNMDKHNVIIATMVLWNIAFIIGFLPQMGWNDQEFDCNFFQFYRLSYVIVIGLLWCSCIVGSCIMQVKLYHARKSIEQGNNFISPQSLEYKKYKQLIATMRNDIVILILCYLPLIIYIIYYFIKDRQNLTDTAHINLIFFLPLFLIRSFISAFIHSYRTVRIHRVMQEISKSMNVSLLKRMFHDSDSNETQSEQISRVNSVNSQNPRAATDGEQCVNACKQHNKLHATASVITTLTEADEEEITVMEDQTKF